MAVEIERKFLIDADFDPQTLAEPEKITQGYLCAEPLRTVRVRKKAKKAFITVKGKTEGAARLEFEYEIPIADAKELLALCPHVLEKDRYSIPFAGFIWEVDIFHGENEGLRIAEIELPKKDTAFEKPAWALAEVTSDERYTNAVLSRHPFSVW